MSEEWREKRERREEEKREKNEIFSITELNFDYYC